MRVTFWGTRGSIATPGPSTTVYGGNTSCVEVRCGSEILIFDAGTGIRPLGQALVDEFQDRPFTVHLFLSHTHWDHIQGFPFFMPAYQPTATIHIYGSTGLGRPLEKLMRGQMDPDYFPVALGELASTLLVHELRGTAVEIRDVTITTAYLNHPGMNLGYRVAHGGKTLVYATDNEPYRVTLDRLGLRGAAGRDFGRRLDEEFIRFVDGADLYIGEAQYTDEEYPRRIGWGHSSVSATVEAALASRVASLALFHHDPMHDDATVAGMADAARRLIAARGSAMHCFAAREGAVIDL